MEKILVLDFGGQYAHLIARRIRSLGVYAEIAPPTTDNFIEVKGIILSGGPSSVYEGKPPKYNPEIFEKKVPILGICYGMQLMAHKLGGKVRQLKSKEFGKSTIEVLDRKGLLKGLSKKEDVWMSHGDSIEEVPEGFEILAKNVNCPVAAMQKDNLYGIQFHAEVTHTQSGMKVLENFVKECDIREKWETSSYINRVTKLIKHQVQDGHVLMAASGGVDSTVATVLLHKALGDNVYCVFVDNGLIRKNEVENVKEIFKREKIKNLIVVDGKKQFYKNLKFSTEPEHKRKIISETFFKIFQDKAAELSKQYDIKFLGQGTIYPDRIESAEPSTNANKIKSHHNVLLPDWLELELVEPLRDLYKDEVREVGKKLGIKKDAINRHPFPGPGLGVRILGEINEEKVQIYVEIDEMVENAIRKAHWYDKLWMGFPVLVPVQEFEESIETNNVVGKPTVQRQDTAKQANHLLQRLMHENKVDCDEAVATLLPVKSVGVMGDARTYENPLCLRFTKEGKVINIDQTSLETISNEMINKIKGVNRVIWDITDEPIGWQNLIVLRAITSKDAMTADWAKFDIKFLKKLAEDIMGGEHIQRVTYDITQKPPGTMEWE